VDQQVKSCYSELRIQSNPDMLLGKLSETRVGVFNSESP